MKVIERADLTADEMIREVTEFSADMTDHRGQMVALVIQAHGDTRGNISGVDGSQCSVQSIVDALCNSTTLCSIPKVSMVCIAFIDMSSRYKM